MDKIIHKGSYLGKKNSIAPSAPYYFDRAYFQPNSIAFFSHHRFVDMVTSLTKVVTPPSHPISTV